MHSLSQRNNFTPPEGFSPFALELRGWWTALPLTEMERFRIVSDLDTLAFAGQQVELLEERLKALAAADARIPLLVQTPGIRLITALAILAAIGDITRFPSAKQLVGYVGLGTRVHDSGLTHANGHITKAGRRDLRKAMVDAANHAILSHPHWQAEYARLEPR